MCTAQKMYPIQLIIVIRSFSFLFFHFISCLLWVYVLFSLLLQNQNQLSPLECNLTILQKLKGAFKRALQQLVGYIPLFRLIGTRLCWIMFTLIDLTLTYIEYMQMRVLKYWEHTCLPNLKLSLQMYDIWYNVIYCEHKCDTY